MPNANDTYEFGFAQNTEELTKMQIVRIDICGQRMAILAYKSRYISDGPDDYDKHYTVKLIVVNWSGPDGVIRMTKNETEKTAVKMLLREKQRAIDSTIPNHAFDFLLEQVDGDGQLRQRCETELRIEDLEQESSKIEAKITELKKELT